MHAAYAGILHEPETTIEQCMAKGTILGFTGFALLLFGMWLKARLEELWLTEELGADAYGNYRRRVPMLWPFGPTGA